MKNKVRAKTSFILGLFFFVPLFNLILGVFAIYNGFKALREIKKKPEVYGGKWYAITGIILGILPLWFGFLYVIILLFPSLETWLLSL
ncbi:DUF4190 domain-containing protein [Nanoarchaeota archaeon]